MIRLYVSTDYVRDILRLHGIHRPSKGLTSDLGRLGSEPFKKFPDLVALEKVTVAELLADSHHCVVALLRKHKVIDRIVQSLRAAFAEYHIANAHITGRTACDTFALHFLGSHGGVKKRRVVLADLLTGFGLFLVPRFPNFGQNGFSPNHLILDPSVEVDPKIAQCHLCDDLGAARGRYLTFAEKKRAVAHRKEDALLAVTDPTEGDLCLHSIGGGFAGIRSLRRDNPEVPMVGTHRLLAASAVRQGVGKRTISGIFPSHLWDQLEVPVQHFVLGTAEKAAAASIHIRYPNMPDPDNMEDLDRAAEETEDTEASFEFELSPHRETLEQLGLFGAVDRRFRQHAERRQRRDWLWDWTIAIGEYHAALCTDNIEMSLHLQNVLDLYPLHKRVLGLLERMICPKLKTSGDAAKRLRNAFTDIRHKHCSWPYPSSTPADGDTTSLEIAGGWLVLAKEKSDEDPTAPLRLDELLDSLIGRINKQFAPDSVTLKCTDLSPAVQAAQLTSLSQPSIESRRSLQALANIAINLRNFIEHATDEVNDSELILINSEFWPRLGWIMDNLRTWHEHNKLAHDANGRILLPDSANRLALTPRSLERCLVIIALILHAAKAQLNIAY